MSNSIKRCLMLVILAIIMLNPAQAQNYKIKKVVIDAGHGGKDPGTIGKISKEKDITLTVALEVGKLIKKGLPDVEVIYTRNTDKFVELHKRADIANKQHADLFISIHCNSLDGKKFQHIQGIEIYAMGLHTSQNNLEVAKRENAVILLEDQYKKNYEGFDPNSPESHILFSLYQNAYLDNSLTFASKLEEQFKNRASRHSRGIKQAGFVVLAKSAMPSVLVEIGFLSNLEEEKYLKSELGQSHIASAIFRAFRDFKEELEASNE